MVCGAFEEMSLKSGLHFTQRVLYPLRVTFGKDLLEVGVILGSQERDVTVAQVGDALPQVRLQLSVRDIRELVFLERMDLAHNLCYFMFLQQIQKRTCHPMHILPPFS